MKLIQRIAVSALCVLFSCPCLFAEEKEYSLDDYTGMKYIAEKKVDVTNGHIQIKLWGDKGCFGLYSVTRKNGRAALLSSYDFFSSSYFSLRVGRKEYMLRNAGAITCESRRTEQGAQLCFIIPKKAYFLVDFRFPSDSSLENGKDMLRVNLYTINLADTPQSFTVKGIFDTILGEKAGCHFSTATMQKLNTQKRLLSMESEKWIRSANKKASIRFLLDGAAITKPEAVTLGTVDELARTWVPEVYDGKAFNSTRAYNNSAVAVNWSTAYLGSMETDVKTFYISVAEDIEVPHTEAEQAVTEQAGTEQVKTEQAKTVQPKNEQAGAEQKKTEQAKIELVPANPKKVPAADDTPEEAEVELSAAAQAVTEEQLDPEYIQNLIDYISSLENGESINKEELESLNKELDAIFEKLRAVKR